MDTLDLKFLGTPLVTWQNRPLKFATRKALALLAYLVVEPDIHPRDNLVALFYPESEPKLAYSGLRNTLARLRETLHDVGAISNHGFAESPLLLERESIGFNFSLPHTLDTDRVSATVETLNAQSVGMLQPAPLLLDATRAARGPFLDGLSLPDAPEFENWVTTQRGAYQRRLDLIFDNLSQQQLDAQQPSLAIETVARWINQNRLNENAYRRLMRLHFLNGDRAAALQTFEICRTLLAQELNTEPAPLTLELLAQIRSHKQIAVTPHPEAERHASLSLPFVGRVQVHQQLTQQYRHASSGQTRVVALVGESGMGKTRLASEFGSWAVVEGADVLSGRAFETGEHLPFQPLIDAWRERLERENAPEDILDDVWLAELARVLPELRERYPDLPQVAQDETTARARLFEAFARLMQALASRRPLVLVIDDVQWAEQDTFELLHYLARRGHENHARVLLVLLLRQEALAENPRLGEWLAGFERELPCAQLTLKPFTLQDAAHLVSALAGEQYDPPRANSAENLAQWLLAETQGDPFFIAETLAHLDENSTLVWAGEIDARKLRVPATLTEIRAHAQTLAPAIRNVIHTRLARLHPSASAMLGAAAIINRNCTFERLCQISGAGESEGLNALDELLAARLLLEAIDDARPYSISHDRIRQVVYSELGKARQKIYHRRELDALTTEHAPAAEIAYHALAAGEREAAFYHSWCAGAGAMQLYSASAAIYHYETARRLLNELRVPPSDATMQGLYLDLGKAYEIQFQQLDALAVYQELHTHAITRRAQPMELAALVASCNVRAMPFDAHDAAQARRLVEQALPLARALGDVQAEAQLEHDLALIQPPGAGQAERALLHAENAARLARLAGAIEPLGMALLDVASLGLALGHFAQSDAACQEAAELFQQNGNRPRLQDAIHLRAMIRLGVGEFERALTFLDEAYAANQALGNATEIFALATTRSTLHILRGDYARAMQEFVLLQEMDEKRITSTIRINVRQQLAWLYFDIGAYDTAEAECQRALSYSDEGQPALQVPTLTLLTLVQLARGEIHQAAHTAAQGGELFDRTGKLYPEWWEALPFPLAQGELALAQGDLVSAASCAEYLASSCARLHLRHHLPAILYFRARVELAHGDKPAAKQDLGQAIQLSDEMGARRELWRMCRMLAELEQEQGNLEDSACLQDKARAAITFVVEHIGAPELRATFLAHAGVRGVPA